MGNQDNPSGINHLSFPKKLLFGLLRQFFKLLYHQFAWTYDWVAYIVSLGAWETWIQAVLPYIEGPSILEIGFGPGHLLTRLRAKELRSFGLDESPQMVRIARKRLSGLSPQPSLLRGKAESLPFADECFHQVVMTFPAEFILKQPTLSEIKRVLMSSGNIILLPMAWITGRRPWERFAAWVNRITGEAPAWNEQALEPLKTFGFDVTWQMVDLPSSRVLIVRLVKSVG